MVLDALLASLQGLDVVLNDFDPVSGFGWYEQIGQGVVYLFQKGGSVRKNVLSMSPAYNMSLVNELFTRLRSLARVEHLPPLTPAQIKSQVMALFNEYTFAKFREGYPEWQSQNAVANLHWQDAIRRDTVLQQSIQPTNVGFTVAPPLSAEPESESQPPPKKAKSGKGAKKTNVVASQPGGNTPIAPQVTAVAAGGGSVSTTATTGPAAGTRGKGGNDVGTSCKFNVRHLFLDGDKCTRGDQDCKFFHQRNIKKGATARNALLEWAKSWFIDEPDYDALVKAIKAKTR
jgi:hypothetical protein